MAIVNKPDMNYGVWAENGNIEIPSSEKVDEGWVIEKPLNEHMNWLQNRSDKMLQYLNQRGMPEWDFRTTYPKDAFVVRSGVMYQAISQNTDKDPSANTNIWKKPFASSGVADGAGGEIEKIKNNDGYLSHYVRRSAPVMDAPCIGVSYYNKTKIAAYTFMKDTQAPAVTFGTNIIATFTGGTEPLDVVTHQQLGAKLQGYLVGDVYITTSSGDPKVRLGYGTWERFAQGEVLVGFSTSVSNTTPQWVKTAGAKFGTYVETLKVSQIPKHKHSSNPKFDLFTSKASVSGKSTTGSTDYNNTSDEHGIGGMSEKDWADSKELEVGNGESHNNVQPSIVVFMWKRTA